MTPEERAAYRAFVREHHPDRGGDPEVFVAGLARFRACPVPPDPSGAGGATGPDRFDAPVEVVTPLPPPLRAVLHLVRIWRRRYRPRVDRPTTGRDHPTPRRPT